MSSKLKRRSKDKDPNIKRKRAWIHARGKFLTVRELVRNVHLLHRNGLSMMVIAEMCEVAHRVVKKILLDPMRAPEEAFPEIASDSTLYAIVSERALPSSLKPEDYPFEPLQGPWLHAARIDKSNMMSVMDRMKEMGTEYGVIDVYRLEKVNLREIADAAVTADPGYNDLGTYDDR